MEGSDDAEGSGDPRELGDRFVTSRGGRDDVVDAGAETNRRSGGCDSGIEMPAEDESPLGVNDVAGFDPPTGRTSRGRGAGSRMAAV